MEIKESAVPQRDRTPAAKPRLDRRNREQPTSARLPSAEACRTRLYESVVEEMELHIAQEEIEIHFAHMPMRYWPRVDDASVRWHLQCAHEFLRHVVNDEALSTSPVVRWRHFPDRGITEVLVCTWDRLGLLSKVAGAFAEVGLNIVRADIFTRADSVVMDIFQVSTEQFQHVADEIRLEAMAKILDAALTAHRDLGLWGIRGDRGRRQVGDSALGLGGLPSININNQRTDACTILEIEARDRVGLLYLIFRVFTECEVDVAQAIITTEDGVAGDVFYLTDEDGLKITDAARLTEIERRLVDVIC